MSWRIVSGALTIMGILGALWVSDEVRTGIAHSRGSTVIHSEDPEWFWILTATNAVVIILFFFGALKAWKQGQRDPNF